MKLTRLQELVETRLPQKTLAEGQSDKAFIGIARLVDEATGDLKDKLGKGGSLAVLFKSSGAAKLDKVKDADGKNVMNQIIALTTEYTKAIQKLMMEAEIMVSQAAMNEGMVAEAVSAEFDGSAEFTDEFFNMRSEIALFKKQMKAPRWMSWMKSTDTNFGTSCEAPARAAIAAVNTLDAQFADIETCLDEADQA